MGLMFYSQGVASTEGHFSNTRRSCSRNASKTECALLGSLVQDGFCEQIPNMGPKFFDRSLTDLIRFGLF